MAFFACFVCTVFMLNNVLVYIQFYHSKDICLLSESYIHFSLIVTGFSHCITLHAANITIARLLIFSPEMCITLVQDAEHLGMRETDLISLKWSSMLLLYLACIFHQFLVLPSMLLQTVFVQHHGYKPSRMSKPSSWQLLVTPVMYNLDIKKPKR